MSNLIIFKKNNFQPKLNFMRFLLIISVLTIFLSCKKDAIKGSYNQNDLTGRWEWLSSSGGITGGTETPATRGYSQSINITADKIQFYTNDILTQDITYTIGQAVSIYDHETRTMLMQSNNPICSYKIVGNKLYLYDECFDCYSSEYIRR
ncbi:MAG TPA: hypothetical protein PKO18_00815 [Chitinophagales bacterium]|nr:hypothetical protein [Chitinophagales bacterium]